MPQDPARGGRVVRIWHDRHGRAHPEHEPEHRGGEPLPRRERGPLEAAWENATLRAYLASEALSHPNPRIEPLPEEPDLSRWTWVVDAPEATAVLLWTNAVFDHRNVTAAELSRLPGSGLWTICLLLPSALRTAYRIAVWREPTTPPWRTANGRRPIILAALAASAADERGHDTVRGSDGRLSSVGAGPDAPVEPWRIRAQDDASRPPAGTAPHARPSRTDALSLPGGERAWVHGPAEPWRIRAQGDASPSPPDMAPRTRPSRTDALSLPGGERAWVHGPADASAATPLLVLFDGQVWQGMGLPDLLDSLVAAGRLPPLHIALLDSHDQDRRWDRLGVPGGQVDTVLDDLLPRVRRTWPVDTTGRATIVAGQSLGGIAALWAAALGEGTVRHVIAQSPSLWRFGVQEALLHEQRWDRLVVQAGTYEPDMLRDAQDLAEGLSRAPELSGREVRMDAFEAGHDWAAWRAGLAHALLPMLRTARDCAE